MSADNLRARATALGLSDLEWLALVQEACELNAAVQPGPFDARWWLEVLVLNLEKGTQ